MNIFIAKMNVRWQQQNQADSIYRKRVNAAPTYFVGCVYLILKHIKLTSEL